MSAWITETRIVRTRTRRLLPANDVRVRLQTQRLKSVLPTDRRIADFGGYPLVCFDMAAAKNLSKPAGPYAIRVCPYYAP